MGMCSREEYEDGKCFLVVPERLCVGAVYAFACKAPPSREWQACLFPAKIGDVVEGEGEQAPYFVTMSFEEVDRPGVFRKSTLFILNQAGYVRLPAAGSDIEEAYLQHRFEDVDNELRNIEQIKTVQFRVETVPPVVPPASL